MQWETQQQNGHGMMYTMKTNIKKNRRTKHMEYFKSKNEKKKVKKL